MIEVVGFNPNNARRDSPMFGYQVLGAPGVTMGHGDFTERLAGDLE